MCGSGISVLFISFTVFGVDLTTIVKLEGGLIPKILTNCIEELQSRGKKYSDKAIRIQHCSLDHDGTCTCILYRSKCCGSVQSVRSEQ